MSLYKYYAPDSFDFICVEGGISIRFSQSSLLNDIFEISYATDFDEKEDIKILAEIITKNIKDSEKPTKSFLIHLTDIYNKLIDKSDFKKLEDTNTTKFGIFSTSKNINSRSMWSYYSNDHQGFMVSFKTNEESQIKIPFANISGSVFYAKEREITKLSEFRHKTVEEKISFVKRNLFFKDDDWEKEEEHRFIAFIDSLKSNKTDQNGFPIYSIILPKEQIEAIYLGVRSSISLERKAKFWIQTHAPNVKLYKAEPCRTEYKLNYIKI